MCDFRTQLFLGTTIAPSLSCSQPLVILPRKQLVWFDLCVLPAHIRFLSLRKAYACAYLALFIAFILSIASTTLQGIRR